MSTSRLPAVERAFLKAWNLSVALDHFENTEPKSQAAKVCERKHARAVKAWHRLNYGPRKAA